jgi:hypothetical protein
MVGTSCRYAPVVFRAHVSQRKQFVGVIASSLAEGRVEGQIVGWMAG